MFNKSNKSILNPTLPSAQPPIGSKSTPTTTKAPAITKQLLAKFENKYTSASKLKTLKPVDSDISDSEQSSGQEIVDVKTKPADDIGDEEAVYESDFEASDSDVSDNEKSTVLSRTHFEDVHSDLPESIVEISDEPILENILTFEDLMKINENQLKLSVDEFVPDNQMVKNERKGSELLEHEIEEIFLNDDEQTNCDTEPEKPQSTQQSKANASKFITESTVFNDNIVSFKELIANNPSSIAATGKQVCYDNNETGGNDSKISTAIEGETELRSVKYDVEDFAIPLVESNVEVNSAKQLHSTRDEEILNEKVSSPLRVVSSRPPANPKSQEKEQRAKTKSKRKSNNRQTLEERRRLERMFFLVEKQSIQGAVEQPVFSPLVMSWEREAEAAEKDFNSSLATPEDAFAEMLRLRLRVTRDKMAAEYAAYRSCCAATQILASSHQPVTLAATRQIISQLKQPDEPQAET